jgi:hypothetical protein
VSLEGDAVKVVLFGMPDAGKSSLLGALAQAAQTQEHLLNARLTDKTKGLMELQRRLYEERPRETLEEVAPYPVSLERFGPPGAKAPQAPLDVVLFDCDGRVANELLNQKHMPLGKPERALARAILDADTLVLVVDASSEPSMLKRDFAQFTSYLRRLEQNRGQRSEVGGLPVYLVLSKCDLLAQSGDTTNAWIDRIEERKREVDRRFQEFLAQQAGRESMPFGKIELHLWATAVKRPQLADSPAKPREPYGVAELFRQAVDSGVSFRQRRLSADRRLKWTLGAAAGLLAAMLLLMVFLFFNPAGSGTSALEASAKTIRAEIPDKPERRFGERLDGWLARLQEIQQHKDFPQLPQDLRDFVNQNVKEMTEYQAFRAQVGKITSGFSNNLNNIRTDADLAAIKKTLEASAPPAGQLSAWGGTAAVQDWKHWLNEVTRLQEAVGKTFEDYERLLADARRFQKKQKEKGVTLEELDNAARKVLEDAKALPDRKLDADRIIPNATEAKYSHVFRFPSVSDKVAEWERSEAKQTVESWAKARNIKV